VSRILLGLLVEAFMFEGDPLVVGIDETLERRWGKKIAAKGSLPRSGPLHPRELREEQRTTVGVRNVVGGDPLGFPGVGFALPLKLWLLPSVMPLRRVDGTRR